MFGFLRRVYTFLIGDPAEFNLERRILNGALLLVTIFCLLVLVLRFFVRSLFFRQIPDIFISLPGAILFLAVIAIILVRIKNKYDKERFIVQANLKRINLLAHNNEYFVKVFAHDIKNYLQADIFDLEALQRAYPEREEITVLLHDQKHINRMILNLINVSSYEKIMINKKPVLIKNIVLMLTNEWEIKFRQKQIVFDLTPASDGQVDIDPQYMELVWDNLMANAHQHTPTRGVFRLVITESEKEFYFAFVNSGPVIPKDLREEVFTKYFILEEQSPYHKGLGLHCAALIIEKHGGSISYRVTHDGLNEFMIAIPKVS